jgi:hypothetical protein
MMDALGNSEADRVDAAVASLNPVNASSLDRSGLGAVLDEIGDSITTRARRQARRRRWSIAPRAAAVVGVVVLALGGAAAGAHFFIDANTGTYPTKAWERKAGGPGEYLNLAGTNFRQVALKAAGDIPYPPGYGAWRTWIVTQDVADSPSACPKESTRRCTVEISTGALRGTFATVAFCAWVYDWRAAKRDGDISQAEQAAQTIDGALSWSAVRALDPHPSASPPYNGRGHKTLFGWFLPFRAAVLRGDVPGVDRMVADNYGTVGCAFVRPPAASKDGTVIPRRGGSS